MGQTQFKFKNFISLYKKENIKKHHFRTTVQVNYLQVYTMKMIIGHLVKIQALEWDSPTSPGEVNNPW